MLVRIFLSEATRIINLYNNDTPLKPIALKSFSVFLPMMLKKNQATTQKQRTIANICKNGFNFGKKGICVQS